MDQTRLIIPPNLPQDLREKIRDRVSHLGYQVVLGWVQDEGQEPIRESFRTYQEYEMAVRNYFINLYKLQLQFSIGTLIYNLTEDKLKECLSPLKGNIDALEISRLYKRYFGNISL